MDAQQFAAHVAAATDQEHTDKPVITAKELSWAEHVAAVKARQHASERESTSAGAVLEILALPESLKMSVGGLQLEVYNLALNTVLEQLAHPFVAGGKLSNEDVALAVMIFANRGFFEALIALNGGPKANHLIRDSVDLKAMLAYLTSDRMAEINPWFRRQFRLVDEANGTPSEGSGEEAGK